MRRWMRPSVVFSQQEPRTASKGSKSQPNAQLDSLSTPTLTWYNWIVWCALSRVSSKATGTAKNYSEPRWRSIVPKSKRRGSFRGIGDLRWRVEGAAPYFRSQRGKTSETALCFRILNDCNRLSSWVERSHWCVLKNRKKGYSFKRESNW